MNNSNIPYYIRYLLNNKSCKFDNLNIIPNIKDVVKNPINFGNFQCKPIIENLIMIIGKIHQSYDKNIILNLLFNINFNT